MSDSAHITGTSPSLRGKRILVAKPGLDGHDIGAKIVALALRNAGADVIYTGLRKTPGYIARVAIDEDVNAVGLSVLSGSHTELTRETIEALRAAGAGDIALFVGGTIPAEDRESLLALGVRAVFSADMSLQEVIASIAEALR
ncbi:MAG: methylmalonyl-CoA mutase [Gammaproteobacteria bacterium]|nr:methylmalonyl-CoA mutase [Gammaproteobacteria bacterium]